MIFAGGKLHFPDGSTVEEGDQVEVRYGPGFSVSGTVYLLNESMIAIEGTFGDRCIGFSHVHAVRKL